MKRALVIALAFAATALGAAPAHAAVSRPRANTTSGLLVGRTTAKARLFEGVRFAEPPVGSRRWTLPVLAHRAKGSVRATKPGKPCEQQGMKGSEDCLFLNVTVPRGGGTRLPVMVWWHGGGYTSGSGDAYDAQRLASQGHVIVITANKRLGIFGYLGLPGLRGGGDFGFADQIEALRWARRNAAAFGGDPGNITVFGESDGAMAACALLTSPAARGLVSKVAMQSGSCLLSWPKGGLLPGTPAQTPYASLMTNRAVSRAAAKSLHCATIACLRKLTPKQLLTQSENFSNVLAYRTGLLPRNPATALRHGDFVHVPVLSGGNQAEEASFVAGAEAALPGTYTAASYPAMLTQAFGAARAARIAQAYPLSAYPSPAAAFASVITDASWACRTLAGNRLLARHTTVYADEFADPGAPNVNGVPTDLVPQGSAHATDLPFLFDLGGKRLIAGAAQLRLSNAMIGYWSSFARSGRPSAKGAARWPAFGAAATTLQLTPAGEHPVDIAAEHRCALWQ
jgi:para-nitrobenzyl esterase